MTGATGVRLSPDELDAALWLVERTGLCSLLPRPLEIDAVRASWTHIRPLLADVELTQYRPAAPLSMLAPKQKYLVRSIHLLDPLDAILYTGVVRRLAPRIERKRVRRSHKRVFSFRFGKQKRGEFRLSGTWSDMEKRLTELCGRYSHVAVADISDFFANIYLHRLQGALFDATALATECQLLYDWFASWAVGGVRSSQGIPIGPTASSVVAEAMLIEIDDFLTDKGFAFARYVDDFYLFANSESDAMEALYSLAEQLMLEDRLELNAAKTRVRTTQGMKRWLLSPRSKLRVRRSQLRRELRSQDPYARIDTAKLSPESRAFLSEVGVKAVLDKALKSAIVDQRLLSAALDAFAATGDKSAAREVIARLDLLSSVAPDVARFLAAQERLGAKHLKSVAKGVTDFLGSESFQTDYQRVWLLEPFTRSAAWDRDRALLEVWSEDTHELVRRQAILALSLSKKRSSRLQVKRGLTNASPWIRRASIYGLRHLTPDEQKHAYPRFSRAWRVTDAMDRAVVAYAKSAP